MMSYDNKTNGVGAKANNRGVSRGAGIGGRGSSKILQRSNIISNNNGTPNLKGNKSKINAAINGQANNDESKYPFYQGSNEGSMLNNNDKEMDIFGNKRGTDGGHQATGSMSKYNNNKAKNNFGNKMTDNNPYEGASSLQMELNNNKELIEEMQQLRE